MEANTREDTNISTAQTDADADFAYYDMLPPAVRRELADAPFNIMAEQVYEEYVNLKADFFRPYNQHSHANRVANFLRETVRKVSYSGAETGGAYRFTYPIHGRKSRIIKGVQRRRRFGC